MLTKGHIIRKYKKIINSHLDSFIINHSKLSIILVYNFVNLITIAALYLLIPILMCYSGNMREIGKAVGSNYDIEFLIGSLLAISFGNLVLYILLKDIDNWKKLLLSEEVDFKKIKEIRKNCINLPYKIYFCQTFLLISSSMLVSIIARFSPNFTMTLIYKINIIVFSSSFFLAVISYTFSRKIFSKILFDTYIDSCTDGVRVNIKNKMCLQIIPMTIATSLLLALLAYSLVIEEKGNILFEYYKLQLQDKLIDLNDVDDSKMFLNKLENIKLKGIKTTYLVVSPEGDIMFSDNSVKSPTVIYFIENPTDDNRIYGITKELQGVIQKVKINERYFSIGVTFEVFSQRTKDVLTFAFICFLLINAIVVYYFSKSISNDISQIAASLLAIPEGNTNKSRMKIPIISNDEIGDLAIAFNRLQQYAMEYDEIKNEFFANVSHELRTPLNIILAAVQLSYNLEKNESVKYNKNEINSKLKTIKRNSYRLLRVINNLIDASKITTSFYDIHLANYNIVNIVEDISLSVIDYVKEKELTVVFDTSIEERIIACDIDSIERIMLNLLSNSVKFTNPGGHIFINMYEENENVIISVKDTGMGIKLEDQKMIFERFKQVDKLLNRKNEGSGIGLYITKLLVEMHKGSIAVKSELGMGTEFNIALPIIVLEGEQHIISLEKQINCQKVINSIDKTEIEFSDISSI